MSGNEIKSNELAKELNLKTAEVVKLLGQIRDKEFKKRTTIVKMSAEEADRIRQLTGIKEVPQVREEASSVEVLPLKDAGDGAPKADPEIGRHVLEIRDLAKAYGKRYVVKDVNISVSTGEIVGLLGPNGAGKTTTFYMVVGMIHPEQGSIMLDGEDIQRLPMYKRAKKGMGYLPQEPSIFRKLTVRDNIRAVLEIKGSDEKGWSKASMDEEVETVLGEFNLKEFADRDGYRLSGGERRRAEIARAIALRPTFMLFDEPFAGIDPIAIIELKKMLNYLKSKQLGILITDHNVRETLSITDRAYIINNGSILAEGMPDELINNPSVKEAYLGEEFRL